MSSLTSRPLTGRHVLLWLGGFFGIVIAANAWFVTLSVRSFHGEDRQRPYQQGLAYNQTLALRAQQKAEGWQAVLDFEAGRLRLEVTGPDGAPVQGLKLKGVLQHPADTFRDAPITLTETGPGLYEAATGNAGHGRRNAVIRSEGPVPFQTERRLWLP
jgi:nitrogen fixation protein FixH